jgi:iron complex outermembrane recepter protein
MGEQVRKHQLRFGLATGVAVAAIFTATAAGAQTPTVTAKNSTEQNSSGQGTAELGAIVVTGTHLLQNGNDLPTPVTVVPTDELLANTPGSLAEAVQTLPELAGMRSPTTRPGDSHLDNASRVVDLNNLGRLRTLTLLDGRRLAPSSTEGETDITFIPSMLMQRVDVVTGGASAVYGSDAVSGVVNFILDHNFNGFKSDVHYGVSGRGDGPETKVGLAAGTLLFDGRGHIEGSFEHLYSPGIASTFDRAWGRELSTVQGQGTTASPFFVVLNSHESTTTYGGLINADNPGVNAGNPLRGLQFSPNGMLSPFQHGVSAGAGSGIESGGDGAYYDKTMAEALAGSDVGFGRFDFDLTDHVKVYAQGALWATHNLNTTLNNEFVGVTLSATNPYLAHAYQAAMTGAGISSFTFSRMLDDVSPNDSQTHTLGYRVEVGLKGDVGGYKWDAYILPSWNRQTTENNANFNNPRADAALDAVVGPNGQIVCNVTITNPGLYPGCVPLNPFGPISNSTAAINYIMAQTQFVDQYTMDDAGADITGAPFSTWAGPVDVALSSEFRHLSYSNDSTARPTVADCTGLRFNCNSHTLDWAGAVINSESPVHQTVAEAALEGDVPLLKDVPFAQALNINLAGRFTHYDTSGSVKTWKVGLNWRLNDEVSFRANRSQDIRAPNLYDLFAPQTIRSATNLDLHTGQNTIAAQITTGNPNLTPEIAQEWTAGIVLRPSFVPNFSVAVDVFSIDISNAITIIQGQDPSTQQICESSNGTSPVCALIVRPLPFSNHTPANTATAFLSAPVNALQLSTQGVDVDANYHVPVMGGDLGLRFLLAYQPNEYVQLPGGPKINQAGAGYGYCCQFDSMSKLRANFFVDYSFRDIAFNLEERYFSGVRWDPDPTLVYAEPNIPSIAYTNLTLTYKGVKHVETFLSVQNVFDTPPRLFGRVAEEPGYQGGFVPGDDVIGRYFTVGFRTKF